MSVAADPAATVMLIRQGAISPEVLMIERHAKNDFLPNMYVFPGGRVNPSDSDFGDRVHGATDAQASAALPTIDAPLALAFFVAAIRETFEECGLLLARRRDTGALVDRETAAGLAEQRIEVQAGRRAFRDVIEEADLVAAADLLTAHAHWVTPEGLPKRFDTIFFTAIAPAGQLADHDGVESTDHVWIRPEQALTEARAGTRRMIFPTSVNLETLAGFAEVDGVIEASRARPVVRVLPRVAGEGEARRILIPGEAGYGAIDDHSRFGG